jgi:hypothetical protein
MPGFIVHELLGAQCPHQAPVTVTPTQIRVLVSGRRVATASSALTIAGCLFQVPFGVGTKPQPCINVKWALLSTRVRVGSEPVLLQPPGPGAGMCLSVDPIPAGPPITGVIQQKVVAS